MGNRLVLIPYRWHGPSMHPFSPPMTEPKASNDWWLNAFTAEERAAIETAFQPLGSGKAEDLAGSLDPLSFGNLAGHLKKEHLRHLAYRLLEPGDALVSENTPILSLHFYWGARGMFFYRWRDVDNVALEEAVTSFQRQIGLASNAAEAFLEGKMGFTPAHAGYRQLRIIEEKRGNLTLARALCEQAKSQGWADDWDKQIARLDKKISKQTQTA